MPDVGNLAKAKLLELDAKFENKLPNPKTCPVQFNPESLKVAFANQLEQPPGGGDKSGGAARQFVGSSTTKLSLTLWFDVGSPQPGTPFKDVRKLTQQVAYFITPNRKPGQKKVLPPAVRFVWGTFQFDGIMDSLEETLEYFSEDGIPLRASLALTLSQQDIQFAFANPDKKPGTAPATPGAKPLAKATDGSNVQAVADAAGKGDDWQSIAAANGIENPRALAAGAMLDLDLRAPTIGAELDFGAGLDVASPSLSLGAGVGISGQISGGFVVASPSLSLGADASFGIGASASIEIGG